MDNFFLCIVQIMHVIGFLLYKYVNDDYSINIISWTGVAILVVSYIVLLVAFMWYWREGIKFIFNKLKLCCSKACKCYKKKKTVSTDMTTLDTISANNISTCSVPHYARYRDSIFTDLD